MPRKQPSAPDSAPSDSEPANSPKAECADCEKCHYWPEDHQTDYNGPDAKFVASTQIAPVAVAFRLLAGLKSGKLVITSIFKWGTIDPSITAAEKADTIAKFKQQVATWSNRYMLRVTDPICGEKTLPIVFELKWSPDDTADTAPYSVNLHRTHPQAAVTGFDIDIGYDSDVIRHGAWVLAHEYGHTLCLADEYFYPGTAAATVTYMRADGSGEVITLEPGAPNIMFVHANRTHLTRFYYFIEVEAQALLRSASGRNVVCKLA